MSCKFYAVEWAYGRATDARTGGRLGRYYSFNSVADRQAWIDDSRAEFTSQGGWRDAIKASDPELRSVIRRDQRDHCEPEIEDLGDYVADLKSLRLALRQQRVEQEMAAEEGLKAHPPAW